MKTKEKLKVIFEEHVKLVEPVISELLLDSVDPRHHEAVKFQIEAGGKRLRPVLAMISCQLMGGKVEDVLYPAAGLEIMHNYTLIVDDIIDHSEFRRNKPTVWKKYGVSVADLFGTYYVSAAFQSLSDANNIKLLKIFWKVLKRINDGQLLDILYEKSGRDEEYYVVKNRFSKVTANDYFEMIGGKTASLFSSCCVVGGVCADATEIDLRNLDAFGLNFGLAFQIQDDILDTFGDEKKIGKEVGKDIKEKKISNIVNLLTLEQLKDEDKKEFENIFEKEVVGSEDVNKAIELINKTDAKKGAQKMARGFVDKAKEGLSKLPQNEWNVVLADLADYVVAREK